MYSRIRDCSRWPDQAIKSEVNPSTFVCHFNFLSVDRTMPKRPCAVVLSPDETDIITGDKFGDVYSVPLLPTPEQDEAAIALSKPETSKAFAPTATETTVHSQANRKALEAQQKQAQGNKAVTKSNGPLKFAHELVLGHVSMLTDVLIASVEDEDSDARPRAYILTSDRDEHIRVSRGPPQAFVIEGFCLGHQAFINKLCLAGPTLLVSGGGDDELYVWDWLEYKLIKKVDLLQAVLRVRQTLKQQANEDESELESKVAVSGLWTCPGPTLGKVRGCRLM
jgi:tRNA (guanine-N(7)-)-methyltransferase subunit TRM82